MNNEKAIWWINMLFTIQELECVKNGDEQKAAEVKETKEYIIEQLKEKRE